uniref:RNase H type-1 domain-containing protein n=1 Tax=Manihot esculenta TaxID=3983 RepID=A0A199UC44_MANES
MIEILALRKSLSWLHKHNVYNVHFESDVKVIVDAILNSWEDWFEFNQIVKDCRDLLSHGFN